MLKEEHNSLMVEDRVTYVDLGLQSGTLWKSVNESESYDYDEVVNRFGENLPLEDQWLELVFHCNWIWTGIGYKVTGDNGKFIVLPAAGFRDCIGGVHDVGSSGNYWSSTPTGSETACDITFDSGGVYRGSGGRCVGSSVRLVQD